MSAAASPQRERPAPRSFLRVSPAPPRCSGAQRGCGASICTANRSRHAPRARHCALRRCSACGGGGRCALHAASSHAAWRAQGEERSAYEKKRAIRKALEGAPRAAAAAPAKKPSAGGRCCAAPRHALSPDARWRPRGAEGRPIPTELRAEEAELRDQASLEDVRTAALTTHADDEYARAGEEDPRIMLTTSRNPSTKLTAFAKELTLVFPNCTRLNRGAQVVKEMVESCRSGGYSDIVIVHEHRGEPDGLVVCHLPFGASRGRCAFAHAPSARPLTRRGAACRAHRVLWAHELRGAPRHQGHRAGHGVRGVPAPHPGGAPLPVHTRAHTHTHIGAALTRERGAGVFVRAGHAREQHPEAPVPGAQAGQARARRLRAPACARPC